MGCCARKTMRCRVLTLAVQDEKIGRVLVALALHHRLARRLGPAPNVALALAAAQVVLCAVTIAVAQAGIGWVVLAGAAGVMLGGVLIWELERSPWFGEVSPDRRGAGVPPLGAPQELAIMLSPER